MLLALLLLAASAPAREVRIVMGTTAELRVEGLAAPHPALDAAFAALDRVDSSLSLWKRSELTRLNRCGRVARPSADLRVVLEAALDVARASQGAFDPTIEPLLRTAGAYGGVPRRLRQSERRFLLRRVGFARVRLDPATGGVRLDQGTALDLGGIAKGYAADRALEALRAAGATVGLADLGGSSFGVFGGPLQVDVRDPERLQAPPWASFRIQDASVSSSGGDQRPGHILDPRTGEPARAVLAATVVARDGMEADALSTAVFVLGEQAGLALVQRRGAAGLVLLREGPRRVIRTTPGFAEAHALRCAPGIEVRP